MTGQRPARGARVAGRGVDKSSDGDGGNGDDCGGYDDGTVASIVVVSGGGEFHPGVAAAGLGGGDHPTTVLSYLEEEDYYGEGGGDESEALQTKNDQEDHYGGRTRPSPCRKPGGRHWSRLGSGRGSGSGRGLEGGGCRRRRGLRRYCLRAWDRRATPSGGTVATVVAAWANVACYVWNETRPVLRFPDKDKLLLTWVGTRCLWPDEGDRTRVRGAPGLTKA